MTDPTPRPVVHIPRSPSPRDVMDILRRLDVVIPDRLAAAAANEASLYSAGHKFTEAEIDEALAGVDVVDTLPPPEPAPSWANELHYPIPLDISTGGALRLKTAMLDYSILEEE